MTEEHVNTLDELRKAISQLDTELVVILNERIKVAKTIGEIKKHYDMPIYVPEVEKRKIEELSKLSLYPGLVETIWPVIMCYTRSAE